MGVGRKGVQYNGLGQVDEVNWNVVLLELSGEFSLGCLSDGREKAFRMDF